MTIDKTELAAGLQELLGVDLCALQAALQVAAIRQKEDAARELLAWAEGYSTNQVQPLRDRLEVLAATHAGVLSSLRAVISDLAAGTDADVPARDAVQANLTVE